MATKVVMISYKNFIYVISTLSSIILSKINDLAQRVHESEILHHFPNLPNPVKVGLYSIRTDFIYFIYGSAPYASCKISVKSAQWFWNGKEVV